MNTTRRRLHGKYLSDHAEKRMTGRRIPARAMDAVLTYGRVAYVRGAQIFTIGRKEVERHRRNGIELSGWEGIQVVCSGDETVLTTYRNHDFRGLRPRSRKHFDRAAA
jgi:hypothetical protein